MNSTGNKSNKPDKNRINPKKALNKKKWREQTYNNKAKVLKWENAKRKQALRQYHKELKRAGLSFDGQKPTAQSDRNDFQTSLKKAKLQYKKIQEEVQKRKKEKEEERKKREAAMKAYREKKASRQKKLFQNRGFGKPSMKGRLELLLEKIQKEYGNNEQKSS